MPNFLGSDRLGLGSRFTENLSDMFDGFFDERSLSIQSLSRADFKIDIAEDENAYRLDIDLPGVKKEEISIDLYSERLIISVVMQAEVENEEEENIIHRERWYATAERSIYLRDAREDGVKAELRDGVLTISVLKEKKKVQKKRKIIID